MLSTYSCLLDRLVLTVWAYQYVKIRYFPKIIYEIICSRLLSELRGPDSGHTG